MRWPLLLVAMTTSSFATPSGRVVKIERHREATIPRWCAVMNESTGLCVGKPERGEQMTVLDPTGGGVLAVVQIEDAVEDRTFGFCSADGKPNLHKVTLKKLSGNIGNRRGGTLVGVRGIRVDSRAQVLKDATVPSGDQVMLAIDTDADSTADLVVTQSACGGNGAVEMQCMDTYLRQGNKRLERVHQERLQQCK